MNKTTRINKYLALQNIATRRSADELIKKGLVFINNKKAVLGEMVKESDKVEVRNAPTKKYVYFAYNKPVGVVTTTPRLGEQEILDIVKFPTKVFPIGRLDKDSRGLLIFTNDGRITDKLLNPKYVHEKEYVVEVNKDFDQKFLNKMAQGVKIENYITRKCQTKKLAPKKFTIILTEGKKRQIRRMCEALGYRVIDLRRIRIMNVNLGNLKENTFRKIEGSEMKYQNIKGYP